MDGQLSFARVREDSKDMITAKLFRCLNRLGTGYMNNLGTASYYYYHESPLNHPIPHITS
jgi:hypothetical protein